MKRIIGIAMCLMMMAGAAQVSAQRKNQRNDKQKTEQGDDRQQPSAEDMAKRQADRMKELLSLTDEQYAKVLELNEEQARQRANTAPASRENMQNMTDEQREARREEMKKVREGYDAKLKEILTDEQYLKYVESRNNGPRGNR